MKIIYILLIFLMCNSFAYSKVLKIENYEILGALFDIDLDLAVNEHCMVLMFKDGKWLGYAKNFDKQMTTIPKGEGFYIMNQGGCEINLEDQTQEPFKLQSKAIKDGYLLSEYMCEANGGTEKTFPFNWSNVPKGASSLAIVMHHTKGQEEIGNLILWDIDTSSSSINYDGGNSWNMGLNSDGDIGYLAPCYEDGNYEYSLSAYAFGNKFLGLSSFNNAKVTYSLMHTALMDADILEESTMLFKISADFNASTLNPHYKAFDYFKNNGVSITNDEDTIYISSNGLGSQTMMVGISSWKKQVPLPQSYANDNTWNIPRNPVPANNPMSLADNFYSGAVGISVDGVPIFNPLDTKGSDVYLSKELDNYGGHAGRADEYHYHIAPLHLSKQVGDDYPIAFMLDGYPLYGIKEPTGADVDYNSLDEHRGHNHSDMGYHYHASLDYPYINQSMRAEVVVKKDLRSNSTFIFPQAKTIPLRDLSSIVDGAEITALVKNATNTNFVLTYNLGIEKYTISYVLENNKWIFSMSDDNETKTHSYDALFDISKGSIPSDVISTPPPPKNPESKQTNINKSSEEHFLPLPELFLYVNDGR